MRGPCSREKKLFLFLQGSNADFEIWLHWVYTGDLVLDDDNYVTIIRLYTLGDNLKDTEFRNAIVDELLRVSARVGYTPSVKTISEAVQPLKPNSRLRVLLLRMLAFAFKASDLETIKASCSHELCCEMLQEIFHSGIVDSNAEPELSKRCEYHVHEDGSKCQGA